jgi:hypothetical protein
VADFTELLEAEDAGWNELHSLMDSLSSEGMERPGYFEEGWSAKDLLGHIGSWLAEAGLLLEQIRFDTYRPVDPDVESMNQRFIEALSGLSLDPVRAQASASRARMLQALVGLAELSPEATFWIRKAGAEHYAEHLPRLREWVAEVG